MKVILRTINVTHPYPFPEVQQNNEQVVKNLIEINPKFGKIIKIKENDNRYILSDIYEYCWFKSIEDVVLTEGHKFNRETYEWETTKEEYRQELIQNNNIAEKLMNGGNRINQEEIDEKVNEIEEYNLNIQENKCGNRN